MFTYTHIHTGPGALELLGSYGSFGPDTPTSPSASSVDAAPEGDDSQLASSREGADDAADTDGTPVASSSAVVASAPADVGSVVDWHAQYGVQPLAAYGAGALLPWPHVQGPQMVLQPQAGGEEVEEEEEPAAPGLESPPPEPEEPTKVAVAEPPADVVAIIERLLAFIKVSPCGPHLACCITTSSTSTTTTTSCTSYLSASCC